jgi:hypothetical protein
MLLLAQLLMKTQLMKALQMAPGVTGTTVNNRISSKRVSSFFVESHKIVNKSRRMQPVVRRGPANSPILPHPRARLPGRQSLAHATAQVSQGGVTTGSICCQAQHPPLEGDPPSSDIDDPAFDLDDDNRANR